jgi:hypothetical protein
VKHLRAGIALFAFSPTGLAFVHPFGNPRVELAKVLTLCFKAPKYLRIQRGLWLRSALTATRTRLGGRSMHDWLPVPG